MHINRIALYHLETLLWIERLGTFAAAAARLHTTQPAISNRVRELESHLGITLFERHGRSAKLTAAGRQLVQMLGPALAQMEESLLTVSRRDRLSGTVRIGAGEIAAATCLPAFAAQLNSDFPGLSLEIEINLTANLLQQLIDAQTDVAFMVGPISHPLLRVASIGFVDLIWLTSPAIAAALQQGTGQRFPLWSLSHHSPLYGHLKDAEAGSGLPSGRINFCNNVRTMIDIIVQGGGIGLFPAAMVANERAVELLKPVTAAPAPAPVPFVVAIRATEQDPVITEIFRQAALLDVGRRGGNEPADQRT